MYETSVVFIPSLGEPIRIHYSNILQVDAKDYSLAIITESKEKLTISRMGKEFDGTSRILSDAINSQNVKVQSLIKDLIPSEDPSVIRNASRLMKDGKAAKKSDIESVSPELWNALEKKLEQTPIWNGYQYLKSLARQDKIAIGIKRGLMGDLTGNYMWLLIPIYGKNLELGNTIALESVRLSSPDSKENDAVLKEIDSLGKRTILGENVVTSNGGNATYFFRIAGRSDYAGMTGNIKELDTKVDIMISRINHLMLDINFRREPIYLSDDKLRTEPEYARYRFALQKLSPLKDLRHLFIGRIIHSSLEQWKSDVSTLFSFNMSTKDDNAKWEKS